MSINSDMGSFPCSGMPVLKDVGDRITLGTFYQNPLKSSGFIIDVLGNTRFGGASTIGGGLTVSGGIAMSGAFSGATTGAFSGIVTSAGLNTVGDISSQLSRVRKAYLKDLELTNTPTILGEPMPEMKDLAYIRNNFVRKDQNAFTSLTDTPTSYSGQSGLVLKVKSTEDGLEFGTGGGGGTPGGSDTQVQFNDGGAFGGQTGFEYDKTTSTLTNKDAGLTVPTPTGFTSTISYGVTAPSAVATKTDLINDYETGTAFTATQNSVGSYYNISVSQDDQPTGAYTANYLTMYYEVYTINVYGGVEWRSPVVQYFTFQDDGSSNTYQVLLDAGIQSGSKTPDLFLFYNASTNKYKYSSSSTVTDNDDWTDTPNTYNTPAYQANGNYFNYYATPTITISGTDYSTYPVYFSFTDNGSGEYYFVTLDNVGGWGASTIWYQNNSSLITNGLNVIDNNDWTGTLPTLVTLTQDYGSTRTFTLQNVDSLGFYAYSTIYLYETGNYAYYVADFAFSDLQGTSFLIDDALYMAKDVTGMSSYSAYSSNDFPDTSTAVGQYYLFADGNSYDIYLSALAQLPTGSTGEDMYVSQNAVTTVTPDSSGLGYVVVLNWDAQTVSGFQLTQNSQSTTIGNVTTYNFYQSLDTTPKISPTTYYQSSSVLRGDTIVDRLKLDSAGGIYNKDNKRFVTDYSDYESNGFGIDALAFAGGYDNLGVGNSAGKNATSIFSIFVGRQAGENSTEYLGVNIGYQAGQNSSSQNSIHIGDQAGLNDTGNGNVSIGSQTGTVAGNSNNVWLGYLAGNVSTGDNNVGIGNNAGANNAGINNVFIGVNAGQYAVNGASICIGYNSGANNTGVGAVCIGEGAGQSNTGNAPVLFGAGAGANNHGSSLTAIGYGAGAFNTGNSNLCFAFNAGYNNTGGYCTMIGNSAGASNSGYRSLLFGNSCGVYNTGNEAILVGQGVGGNNTGSNVVGMGSYCLNNNSGNYVVALGEQAGLNNTKNKVIAIGWYAGAANTGESNILIGSGQGQNDRFSAGSQLAIDITDRADPLIHGNFTNRTLKINNTIILNGLVSAPTANAGQIYYNSSDNHFYGYDGSTWKQLDN